MASETEAPQVSSLFERLSRHRELYLFLPFILRSSNTDNGGVSRQNAEHPDQERTILVNPFTQGTVVIGGASDLEALVRGWANKDGHPPASEASIEAMPSVGIGEDEDGECVVCLEEWTANEVAKEMPCRHRFHGDCIEKWLKIHGSCPVCRYKMPVDDEDEGKERQIWVRFSFFNGPSTGSGNENETQD